MDGDIVPSRDAKENAAKVAQACIRCRQKKSKCDGVTPSCSTCAARGDECAYRGYQKRRGLGKRQHVRALEKRLADLEALAQRSGTFPGKQGGTDVAPGAGAGPASAEHPPRTDEGSFRTPPATVGAASGGSATLENDVERLKLREEAERRFPLFKVVADSMAGEFKPKATGRNLTSIPGDHVPVREAETWLVQNTVETLCDEYPLFDVPALQEWVKDPATPKSRHKPAEWACLNALIAVSLHIKTINRSYKDVAPIAWAYLKNAYSALPEVMIQENGTTGPQAAIAMAMFLLRASGDTWTASMLLSVAVRAIQTSLRPTGGPQLEAWKRMFWVSYVTDTEMSMNCGLPPLHHDEDLDVPLPRRQDLSDVSERECELGANNASVFPYLAQMATIQSRIRRDLYSVKAFTLRDDDLIEVITGLSSELEAWRSKVPLDIQPGRHNAASETGLDTPVLMLHVVYCNALTMVHWAVERHTDWRPRDTDIGGPHERQIVESVAKLKTGFRLSLHILPRTRSKPLTDTWRIMPYILASGLALLTFILRDPSHTEATLNRKLIKSMTGFVEELVSREGLPFQGLLKGCRAISETVSNAVYEDPPMSGAGFPRYTHPQTQAVFSHLRRITHPMYVAQALLGNSPNRDSAVVRSLSEALSMPWDAESSFSPWVSEALRPAGYGFKFDLTPRT